LSILKLLEGPGVQIDSRTEPLRGKCSPADWILPTDIF
jgi:hypothetical protein